MFNKRFDELEIKAPKYSIYTEGSVKKDGGWKECSFFLLKTKAGTLTGLELHEHGSIEPFDKIKLERIKLSWFNRNLIKTYEALFHFKVYLLTVRDRALSIKKNIIWVLLAAFGASCYYMINVFFNDALKNLINDSNLAQSVIVFLSLSSVINMFHPFTFRKELGKAEVNMLITKRAEEDKREAKRNPESNIEKAY